MRQIDFLSELGVHMHGLTAARIEELASVIAELQRSDASRQTIHARLLRAGVDASDARAVVIRLRGVRRD
jgi:hypothetical protein